MTQKVFFDTNVLLDLLLPERKSACVVAILSAVKMHKFEGQISTQSILDAKYSSRKQGIPFERFKAFYEELRRFINFGEIDPMHLDWAFEHYSGDLVQLQERNSELCPMTVITPEEFLSQMLD